MKSMQMLTETTEAAAETIGTAYIAIYRSEITQKGKSALTTID
jgi:hypothetical protein